MHLSFQGSGYLYNDPRSAQFFEVLPHVLLKGGSIDVFNRINEPVWLVPLVRRQADSHL